MKNNNIGADQKVRIKLHDGKSMYGVLRGSLNRPVILMVHGLTGYNQEHIFFNGARFFDKHGISSLRINLYSDENDARCLTNCTLKTHALDITMALRFLRNRGVQQIFALGHSYGGPSIMLANQNLIDGYVMWDSSYKTDFIKLFGAKRINKNLFKIKWHIEFLVCKAMIKYSKNLNWDEIAKKIKKPVLAIYAGKGILQKSTQTYARLIQGPCKLIKIPGATHCFDEDGAEDRLFNETLKWIKQQS